MPAGTDGGFSSSFRTSFTDINQGLFGQDSTVSSNQSGSTTRAETQQESLQIDKAGILKFIEDILSSEEGLANIFSKENIAGVYDSTVAKQETESLLASIAGELAKLTGTKTVARSGAETVQQASQQTQESEGLVDRVLGVF